MVKTKKAQMDNEFMNWVVGIIIFLIILGALYFLFKKLGVF